MAPYALLVLALAGAALTLNAHYPIRGRATFLIPSFIAAWIASELAFQHLALQLVVAAAFVHAGALDTGLGRVALGISLLSWAGMVALALASRRSGAVLDAALNGGLAACGLAPACVATAPNRLLMPFSKSDPQVKVHFDLRYADGEGSRHLLDVYASKQPRTKAPVLLQIHGGGWFTGHKRQQALPLMLHLVRCGFVCVSANYRLSPRATFPQHLQDVKLALAWVREHVAEYGGDPDWIAITGGSAGAHLAALAALTPNDPEYQPGFEEVDTRVRGCVPFYGVYDFTDRLGHQHHDGMHRLVSRWILKKDLKLEPEAFDRASPMWRVDAHAPPFFVIHGTHDNLAPVEDARAFVELLRAKSRQPVVYAELPGAHHGFEIFHSGRTARAVHAVACFLTTIHARDVAVRAALASLLAVLGATTTMACSRAPEAAPALAPTPAAVPNVRVEALEVSPRVDSGVTVAQHACQAGSAEQCNALDDDCNGIVDDGCGYASGQLQVTLGWDSGADVDLYVTEPSGQTLMYKATSRSSSSGGQMDQDARGECRPEQAHTRVENVFWAQKPPSGQYKVEVGYWAPCGDAGETHTTVSIGVGGRVLGVYGYSLHPEERATVATFTLR